VVYGRGKVKEPDFPGREALRIRTLYNLSVLDTRTEERYNRLTRIAQRVFDAPIVLISLVDTDRQWFKSSLGLDLTEMPRSISFCGHAILYDEVFVIPDAKLDQRFSDNPIVIGEPHIRFYAGQPLKAANNQIMGTLCILAYQARQFSAEDIALLKDLSSLVEKEINSPDLLTLTSKLKNSESRLIEALAELKIKEANEQSRNRCLEMVSRGFPLNQIMEFIVLEIEEQYPKMVGCVLLVNEETHSLRIHASPTLPKFYQDALKTIPIKVGGGASGTAVATGERYVIENLQTHPYSSHYAASAKRADLSSSWSQPIKSVEGKMLGAFSISTHEISTPNEADIHLIEQTANLISIAIERDLADSVIQRQANYDALTGLPNRHLLEDRLGYEIFKAQRVNRQVALLFLDLDHFKDVNDTLGHEKGDQLLIVVAERLLHCVRTIDTVARLGGDEFTIVMGELQAGSDVDRVASKVIEALSKPFYLDDEVIYLSASMGITVYPDNAKDIETLLKNADQAMYVAKSNGRNRFKHFEKTMHQIAMNRMSMVKDLHHALSNQRLSDQQLVVYYQPIVNLKTGEIQKAEALLRWQHPQQGLILPGKFIPLAEEIGLVIGLGNWVFEQVIRQLIEWRKVQCPDFEISINTSLAHFRDDGINILSWIDKLKQAGLPGNSLGIEIKEGLLMENRLEVSQHLIQLRSSGMTISLDDFGTGYSSLSYLQKFEIDYLKIDRSFVKEMALGSDSLVMCEAIIMMAHKLKLKVIAEGVETEQQRVLLTKAGCDYAQGFFFSDAVPVGKFSFSRV
jgi:diguanylate cyclase (GGDEF)-like protein